jgi:hypothetical protein
LFNQLLPFDLNVKVYFPDLYSLTESESIFLFRQFLLINSTINEYNKVKQEIKRKQDAIKRRMNVSKLRYRKRR